MNSSSGVQLCAAPTSTKSYLLRKVGNKSSTKTVDKLCLNMLKCSFTLSGDKVSGFTSLTL